MANTMGFLWIIGWELPAGISTYVLVPFHAATYVSPSALDAHTNAMGTEECAGNLIPKTPSLNTEGSSQCLHSLSPSVSLSLFASERRHHHRSVENSPFSLKLSFEC